MYKSSAAVSLITFTLFAAQLAGCDSKQEAPAPAVQASAGGATATVTLPASPPAPAGQTPQAAPVDNAATATIAADGSIEAKAGDVSVKLPN